MLTQLYRLLLPCLCSVHWVIDGQLKGNKLRFANHSSSANCRPEILTVDGDHRVAIVANKDLQVGEEIFYNYNYRADIAPKWAVDGKDKKDHHQGVQGAGVGKKKGGGKK